MRLIIHSLSSRIISANSLFCPKSNYQIAKGNLTLEEFLQVAPTDEGLFRGFLHPYLLLLEEDKLLKAAMKKVIMSDIPVKLDSAQSFKLRSLGLIKFKGNEVECLCNLYRLYFRERLLE
ncbi:AAA-like domain-containing protein [Brasilonema sp. CT11]|nr:AAA-like domain-containing protein [Brasilonema sp. CT11]